VRIRFFRREKAAYIKLRRLGYAINALAKMFGRSTSVIHRLLKVAHYLDLRKLPARVRLFAAKRQRLGMIKYLKFWENFAFGIGERPP